MSIKPVNQCLDAWLVEGSEVAGGLPRLLTQHHGLWADQPESINHDFTLHALHGVYYYCYCTLVQRLERLQDRVKQQCTPGCLMLVCINAWYVQCYCYCLMR